MIITNLFNIEIAKSYNLNQLTEVKKGINYVSRTKKNNGVSAVVEKIDNMTIYPSGTITVPLVGSVMMASLQIKEYCCSQNIAVLTPLVKMTSNEKMFYCVFIQKQAEKFSYGRNGHSRIKEMEVPSIEQLPIWVNQKAVKNVLDMKEAKEKAKVSLPPISEWRTFKYEQLFNLIRGQGPTATEAKKNVGKNSYVGASAENNGITQYTNYDCCHKAGTITVANNGSIGEAFYQDLDYLASSDVTVLEPLFVMNSQTGLFLVTLIKAERYRYNYGRKWGISRMKSSTIKVPIDKDGNIDTELITKYMNSLSYSKYL